MNRYSSDVLAKGWQQANRPTATKTPVERDMVLEEPTSGFVGAVGGWEDGVVILEGRKGKRRSFPFGPNFWLDGKPVDLTAPARPAPTARDRAQQYNRTHTASGSRVGPAEQFPIRNWPNARLTWEIMNNENHTTIAPRAIVTGLRAVHNLRPGIDEAQLASATAAAQRRLLGIE